MTLPSRVIPVVCGSTGSSSCPVLQFNIQILSTGTICIYTVTEYVLPKSKCTTAENEPDEKKDIPLTEEERRYLPYAWRLLGGEDLDSLPVRQVGRVLRGFGKNPSEQDIQYIKYDKGIDDNGRLTYNEFVSLYRACAPLVDTEDKLLEAFRVFDKDNVGTINSADVRDILTRLGEPLSPSEVDKMFRMGDFERNGVVKYEDFCKLVMGDNRPMLKI